MHTNRAQCYARAGTSGEHHEHHPASILVGGASASDQLLHLYINFWGVVYGVKYFLPVLKQQPRAHIVNLSSVFGIIGPVGQSAYSASKFAVRGFSEVLRHELEASSVSVSVVHPGGIHTPIAKRARLGAHTPPSRKEEAVAFFEKVTPTSPEAAAARILKGVDRREPRILIGGDARQIDIVQRLRPASYWKIMSKKAGRTPPP